MSTRSPQDDPPWPPNALFRAERVDEDGNVWTTFAGDIPEDGRTHVVLDTFRNGIRLRDE